MAPDWSQAGEVLCVRLDTIGDVLMTGPAIRAVKESAARPRLTLLTSTAGAAVAALMPGIDDTIAYDPPWMKAGGAHLDPSRDRAVVEVLRECGFDAAIIFTVYSQSPLPAALMCHLADIRLRLAHCRENPYGLLTHHVPEPEPAQGVRHEVRRQLDLVATVGAVTDDERLRLTVSDAERERADDLLADLEIERDRPWAIVHPGASAPSRRYPPERWAEVCRALARDHGVQLLLTGDAGEVALVESVRTAAGVPVRSLAGRLGLPTLAALIEAAPLLMAGNTGPVHVAAAVGTPVVDVYALTNPQHTPWGVSNRVLSHDVPCRWCYKSVCPEGHHLCLRGVAASEVVEAALALTAAPSVSYSRPMR